MDEELIRISEEIFRDVIARLTLHLRFMDIALNRFVFIGDTLEYRCDGKYFHYSPITVIRMYQNDPVKLARGYLHIVLHSVFSHVWFAENRKPSLWDLACDIAVENVALELGIPNLSMETDRKKKRQIRRLKDKLSVFTAHSIYHALEDMERDEIKLMSELFRFDDHSPWYSFTKKAGTKDTLFGDEVKDDASKEGNNTFDKASHDTGKSEEKEDPAAKDAEIRKMKNTMKDWKEISEKIELDLETFSKEGGHSETMVQSLKKLHREKYDYSSFLKRFMRMGEKMQINDADFEPIFYTYGLRLYRNLPLIEPLEFKEVRNVRDLVIAIDTSGSVQGDIVQGFLQKTYDLFQQSENFFSHFNIHILQCDLQIRDQAVITNRQQFETYINNLEIKGLGGTDFRPVFRYVEEQIEQKKFSSSGGLLYFTDGDGAYPKTKPSYKTAFLFPEGNKDITVPPWAIKYRLEGDEFHAYSSSQRTD